MAARARAATAVRPALPSARVERFFRRHLRHWEGRFAGDPFALERWQLAEIVSPIFDTLTKRGLRQYREALVGIPRGNGKSPLAAGIALYGLFGDNEPGAQVFTLAASKLQARIIFDTASRMVRASPQLDAMADVYRDAIEVKETGSVFRVLSSDARLAHGYNPHIVTVDELHQHPKPDLYEAMLSALHKRTQPLLLSITTAGWDRDSICWRLYQRGLAGDDPRFFFRWWGLPDGCDIKDTKAWRAANPASWITIAGLRDQLRAMPEPVWRRLHGNQWTSNEASWVSGSQWDANDGPVAIPLGAPVTIVVDAASKKDTTAVVVVYRDPDGAHHWQASVRRSDRIMGYTDFLALEEHIRQLCLTYEPKRVVFDPFLMVRTMLALADEGLPVEEYPQNHARMVPASQTLYDLVLEGRLHHGGDAELRTQALNAAATETTRGWMLQKLRSGGPIDAIVAGAIGSHLEELDARRGGQTMVVTLDDDVDELVLDDDAPFGG